MRIFVGLEIPHDLRFRIDKYMQSMSQLAPDARWVRIESLHVTLKFIGESPEGRVRAVEEALSQIKASTFQIEFKDVGFFPSPKSARVFWIGIHAPQALPQLASAIDEKLEKLGIAKEGKPYKPHLTLARAPERGGGRCFHLLQQRLTPDASLQFGTMAAREFFLYKSELLRGGARYTKLRDFRLDSSGL